MFFARSEALCHVWSFLTLSQIEKIKVFQLIYHKTLTNFVNLFKLWFKPTYKLKSLFDPNESIEPNKLNNELFNIELTKQVVFPVYRSPKINCRCPLPTGNILSTTLNPITKESLTFPLKAILIPLFNRLS